MMANACTLFLRRLPWLAFVCAIVIPASVHAQTSPNAGLVDGMDILKLYSAGSLLDTLVQRMPPDVREQVQKSTWINRTFAGGGDGFLQAAANNDNVVIGTRLGPIPVDRKKLKRAVESMVQFLPQQPEFVPLLRSFRDSAPEKHRDKLDQVIEAFAPAESATTNADLGFMQRMEAEAARLTKEAEKALARTAITIGATAEIMNAIEKHSEGDPDGETDDARRGLRQRLMDDGFAQVYRTDVPPLSEAVEKIEQRIVQEIARQEAAERARTEAEAAQREREERERKAEETRQAACATVDSALAAARPDFQAGRVEPYLAGLNLAAEALETAGGPDVCPDQHSQIERGKSNATVLANVTAYAQQALATCDAARLSELSTRLAGRAHPFVSQLHARVTRVASAIARLNEAGGALLAGQHARAAALYSEASAGLSAEPGICAGLHDRIRTGMNEIALATQPKPEANSLAEMETACRGVLGEASTPVPDPSLATGYTCDCMKPFERQGPACVRPPDRDERLAAVTQSCKNTYGQAAYAQLGQAGPEGDTCHCTSGFAFNQDQTQCVRSERTNVIADAHRACQRANNNRRARATRYLGNGQWACAIMAARQPRGQRSTGAGSNQNTYDPAAAAAAAAVFIQGVGILMNQRRGSGGAVRTRATRCHIGPDGRQHCGAN